MPTNTDAMEFITNKINNDRKWATKAFASLIYDANKDNEKFHEAVNEWKSNPPTTNATNPPANNATNPPTKLTTTPKTNVPVNDGGD